MRTALCNNSAGKRATAAPLQRSREERQQVVDGGTFGCEVHHVNNVGHIDVRSTPDGTWSTAAIIAASNVPNGTLPYAATKVRRHALQHSLLDYFQHRNLLEQTTDALLE
jgi:hypothetical protein